jgi:hypothetical protein
MTDASSSLINHNSRLYNALMNPYIAQNVRLVEESRSRIEMEIFGDLFFFMSLLGR